MIFWKKVNIENELYLKDSLNLKKFRRSFKFGYIYIYTKEKLMVFRILSMDFINNKTIMNELDCMEFGYC